MEVKDINELKILKYITQTIGAQAIIDYITAGGSIDTLKELGLITKTVPTEVIEEEIGLVTGYTFTIVPTPADATVVINGEQRTSVDVEEGTVVEWTVSKEGYVSQFGNYTMSDSDYSLEVELTPSSSYENEYFTVRVLDPGIINISNDHFLYADSELYYRLNSGEWLSGNHGAAVNMTTEDILQLKGRNPGTVSSGDAPLIYPLSDIRYEISGNILSLAFSDDFKENKNTPLPQSAFQYMFCFPESENEYLVSAENLVLPSTNLSAYCYNSMFYGCTNLVKGPAVLPATTLAERCYYGMFIDCTSLTNTPELPATTLAHACYDSMFHGCTGLTVAPELPATTLASNCYQNMFYGCTSLTAAPALPATVLMDYCYNCMFYGCTSLNHIECHATNISASHCTISWTNGVAASGTFVKNSSMNDWTSGPSGIPNDWTVQNA